MKNHKGTVPALLTLGLVLVGTLVTLGSSFFVNKTKNIALNSRAATGVFHKCNLDNPIYTIGGYYICSGKNYWYSNCTNEITEGTNSYCAEMNDSVIPTPTLSGVSCSGTGYRCDTNDCDYKTEVEVTNRQCSGERVCCYKKPATAPTNYPTPTIPLNVGK